jgi:hypothetical protein
MSVDMLRAARPRDTGIQERVIPPAPTPAAPNPAAPNPTAPNPTAPNPTAPGPDDHEPLDETGLLLPARGIVYGLMISLPIWLFLGLVVWLAF